MVPRPIIELALPLFSTKVKILPPFLLKNKNLPSWGYGLDTLFSVPLRSENNTKTLRNWVSVDVAWGILLKMQITVSGCVQCSPKIFQTFLRIVNFCCVRRFQKNVCCDITIRLVQFQPTDCVCSFTFTTSFVGKQLFASYRVPKNGELVLKFKVGYV